MKNSRNILIAAIAAIALAAFNSAVFAVLHGILPVFFSIFKGSVISIPTLLVFCGGIAFELLARYAKKPKIARIVAALFPTLVGVFFAISGLRHWYGGFPALLPVILGFATHLAVAFWYFKCFGQGERVMTASRENGNYVRRAIVSAICVAVVAAIAIVVIRHVLLTKEMEKYRAIVEYAETKHAESIKANEAKAVELAATDKTGLWKGLQFKELSDISLVSYYRQFTDLIAWGNYASQLAELFEMRDDESRKATNFKTSDTLSDTLGVSNSDWGAVRTAFRDRSYAASMNEAMEKMATDYAEALAAHFPVDTSVRYQMAQVFAGWGAGEVRIRRGEYMESSNWQVLKDQLYTEQDLDTIFRLKLYEAITAKIAGLK